MKLTFLGTGAATPSRTRNMTALALQFDQSRALWLFDCGEGTQHQILRSPLSLSRLDRIFITHLHGDHFFGLLGLLSSRSMQDGSESPVTLYGPEGLADYFYCTLKAAQLRFRFTVNVITVHPGEVYAGAEHSVACIPLNHGIASFAYSIHELEKPGPFDPEAARALGVAEGPLYGRLKQGDIITLPDGREINGRTLVGPPMPGRKVVICGDTGSAPGLAAFAADADVLVHEATYLDADMSLALRSKHSTAAMAASAARDANAKALILTHISPRYEGDSGSRVTEILAEAQAIFPETVIAWDLWSYDVLPRN